MAGLSQRLQSRRATLYASRVSTLLEQLGPSLAALRDRRGLSQREVERRAELSLNSLTRYEGGKAGLRLDTLEKILRALDADLYDLGVEARKAAGGETPTTNGETGPREGRLRLTEEWERLEEEARATARWMVERELRDLRGLDPGPGGGSGA